MCGRYFLEESPELRPIVEAMNRSPLLPFFRNASDAIGFGEVAPSCVVPVIASNRSDSRSVFPMRWGFSVPKASGSPALLINARVETAAIKPTFREAWNSHRCIVPASYYFEWEHFTDQTGKKAIGPKYRIRPEGAKVTWLCGLYRIENGLPSFVILTKEPAESIRFIHDRMPLMLPDDQAEKWIRPETRPEEITPLALTGVVYEKAV